MPWKTSARILVDTQFRDISSTNNHCTTTFDEPTLILSTFYRNVDD